MSCIKGWAKWMSTYIYQAEARPTSRVRPEYQCYVNISYVDELNHELAEHGLNLRRAE